MTVRPRIVVVGSSNTDFVVAVDRIPRPGETVLGGDFQTIPGGKGANQAVAAARLGGDVTFVARVGDDAYGAAAIEGYQRDGIDTRFVLPIPGVPSGIALIAVEHDTAQNAIVVAPGANARLTSADIEAATSAFHGAAAVLVSLEIPDAAVLAAVVWGKVAGACIIVNPAPARSLSPEVLSRVDVLTPNETELELLGGVDALLAGGVGAVVETRGSDGVRIHRANQTMVEVPALPVTPVDTVAAGDCFTGALAVELAHGAPLEDAVAFANRAAAVKVTRHGAQPGIPTTAELEAYFAP